MKWPYAAMVQREMVPPAPVHDLLFAGALRRDPAGETGLYGDRTALVWELHRRLWPKMAVTAPGGGDVNNRMLVSDVAASAHAHLGFGRPDVPGWVDTRVFQVAGAGGVLIHDDVGGILTPGEHFVPFERASVVEETKDGQRSRLDVAATAENVVRAVHKVTKDTAAWAIRERAFAHVQKHHTWVNRVQQALAPWFGGK
jgi:hypothetical protein